MMTHILALMERSKVHSNWTVSDIWRLIMPPLFRGQFVEDTIGNNPIGIATYGFFSDEAWNGYRTGFRKLREEDFNSGDNIVLIDVIAPYSNAKKLMYQLRDKLRREGHRGKYISFIRKYSDHRKVQKVMI